MLVSVRLVVYLQNSGTYKNNPGGGKYSENIETMCLENNGILVFYYYCNVLSQTQ